MTTTASSAVAWSERPATEKWLLSEAGDYWIACAGSGILLLALILVLYWWGERELSAADVLLGELHLGATYDAIARRRLWRSMPLDVLIVPAGILALTCALMLGGYTILVITGILYLGAWHRGRQNLGIARYYQLRAGGAISPWHGRLFQAAIYLPMAAGVAYYTSTAPLHEGDEYLGLALDEPWLWALAGLALASLASYFVYALRQGERIHPGERWLVAANAVAFGSAYVLGAWNVAYILVLALHHEVQYLYFTYAIARRSRRAPLARGHGELHMLAAFSLWPAIGLASWAACKYSDAEWVAALLLGGLLCHYWLDSRIWMVRAWRLGRG